MFQGGFVKFPTSVQEIHRLDASGMLSLLTSFSQQLGKAEEIMGQVHLSLKGGPIRNVVVAGMGGSAIGGDLLRNYLVDTAGLPILVNRGYALPRFSGNATLVFACSYSGDTEETLSACRQALQRGSEVIGIASGGQLADLAAREGFPLIRIPGGYPPRAALGYMFTVLLLSMSQLGFIGDQAESLREAQALIHQRGIQYGVSVPLAENQAQQVALKLHGKFPVFYAWSHYFEAVALRWRGQLAENSKQLSGHHLFPEMNHNEIVGWGAPENLMKKSVAVLLRDEQDPKPIQKRMQVTKELIADSPAEVVEVWAEGASLLARLFSLVCLGDFVSFYLAMLNGVDPTPVCRIEQLKKRLAGGTKGGRPAQEQEETK
jgi:glucose/mannose-6-phosphate isomerase